MALGHTVTISIHVTLNRILLKDGEITILKKTNFCSLGTVSCFESSVLCPNDKDEGCLGLDVKVLSCCEEA